MTDAITLLLLVAAALAFGIWVGRRRALFGHRCPPRFTTEQIFAMQEREWENRGTKRYDVVNVHAPGRHREDGAE